MQQDFILLGFGEEGLKQDMIRVWGGLEFGAGWHDFILRVQFYNYFLNNSMTVLGQALGYFLTYRKFKTFFESEHWLWLAFWYISCPIR